MTVPGYCFLERLRDSAKIAWLALVAPPLAALAAPPAPVDGGADLFSAPVYYERYLDKYANKNDLPLLRAGHVRVKHYDPVDVSNFDWNRRNEEYTWFMQMQEMRFILPLLARHWLESWYNAHPGARMPDHKWGEPMTFAFRGMVFVYYLKMECARTPPDTVVVTMLTKSIAAHQKFLEYDHNFDRDNNHGMIDALGLLETTRVHPNPVARDLAFERIRIITRKSVSKSGTHMEHSPLYHFVFMRWVEDTRDYVRDLPDAPPDLVTELELLAQRMRVAGHFLQDHAGMIPQIGDTDSVSVVDYSPEFRSSGAPDGATRFYDRAAGYAIFKGVESDRRYVVLRIPEPSVALRAHLHFDALALLVTDDGEVILGDSGRYTYTRGGLREYFVSAYAHNTILPWSNSRLHRALQLFRPVAWARDESRDDTTRWVAAVDEVAQDVSRAVSMPASSQTVVVVDTIRVQGSADSSSVARSATVLWNLGADVDRIEAVETDHGGVWSWTLETRRGRNATLSVTVRDAAVAAAKVRLVRGEDAPMLAWYAPRQGVRRPVWGIEIVVNADPMAIVETRLVLPPR
jgi:hypothetical protein